MVRQTIDFLITTVVQFLSSLCIIFFLLNIKVLKPVERLIEQSRSLARKELHKKFHWEQTDEMGVLGQSFEKTRQSLLKLFDALKKKIFNWNIVLTNWLQPKKPRRPPAGPKVNFWPT